MSAQRRRIAPLAALMVASLLVGCGGADDGNDSSDARSTDPATGSAPSTRPPGTNSADTDAAAIETTPPTTPIAPTESTTPTETATPTETTGVAPIDSAVPDRPPRYPEIATTPAEPGAKPLLTWAPVAGAALYRIVVLDPDGEPYWAWSGTDTSVPVGGNPDPAALGARIDGAMTWQVAAFDGDGTPLAISTRGLLSP